MISMRFNCVPPTATAQQKGVFVRNGRAHFFKKKKVAEAEDFLAALLAPHAPAEPLHGGIYLQARWCFPYRQSERKSVTRTGREIPHTSRPDLDNLEKSLLDVLTRLRFWEDDARTFTKSTGKFWGPKPYLAIAIKTEAELYNMGGGNG
jgi:Holliday junction resolvase RusA-like endonuclease